MSKAWKLSGIFKTLGEAGLAKTEKRKKLRSYLMGLEKKSLSLNHGG